MVNQKYLFRGKRKMDSNQENEPCNFYSKVQKTRKSYLCSFLNGPGAGPVFREPCILNGKKTRGIVDSGAQLTVISRGLLDKLGIVPKLVKSDIMMKTANGTASEPSGKFYGEIQFKGRTFLQKIFVLDSKDQDILLLGTDFSSKARLVIDFCKRTVRFRDEYENRNMGDMCSEMALDIYKPPRPLSPLETSKSKKPKR